MQFPFLRVAALVSSCTLQTAAFFPSFFLPSRPLSLFPDRHNAAAGCTVETQFEFDLHPCAPCFMGSTHESKTIITVRVQRANTRPSSIISFDLNRRVWKRFITRSKKNIFVILQYKIVQNCTVSLNVLCHMSLNTERARAFVCKIQQSFVNIFSSCCKNN